MPVIFIKYVNVMSVTVRHHFVSFQSDEICYVSQGACHFVNVICVGRSCQLPYCMFTEIWLPSQPTC
jgi:hypothetical protein